MNDTLNRPGKISSLNTSCESNLGFNFLILPRPVTEHREFNCWLLCIYEIEYLLGCVCEHRDFQFKIIANLWFLKVVKDTHFYLIVVKNIILNYWWVCKEDSDTLELVFVLWKCENGVSSYLIQKGFTSMYR